MSDSVRVGVNTSARSFTNGYCNRVSSREERFVVRRSCVDLSTFGVVSSWLLDEVSNSTDRIRTIRRKGDNLNGSSSGGVVGLEREGDGEGGSSRSLLWGDGNAEGSSFDSVDDWAQSGLHANPNWVRVCVLDEGNETFNTNCVAN